MDNLAGHPDPDPFVRRELQQAGIDVVPDDEPQSGEVATRLSGMIVTPDEIFVFSRAWYYWRLTGKVPIEIARQIYRDEFGSWCRVGGQIGLHPDEWCDWYTPSGLEILPTEQEDAVTRWRDRLDPLSKFIFSDDPASIPDAAAFVCSYHIDTQEGLDLMAARLRSLQVPS